MVRLELVYSTRNRAEFDQLRDDLGALASCPIGPDEWRRAIDVYGTSLGREERISVPSSTRTSAGSLLPAPSVDR